MAIISSYHDRPMRHWSLARKHVMDKGYTITAKSSNKELVNDLNFSELQRMRPSHDIRTNDSHLKTWLRGESIISVSHNLSLDTL